MTVIFCLTALGAKGWSLVKGKGPGVGLSARDAHNQRIARTLQGGRIRRGRIVELLPLWKPWGYTAINVVLDIDGPPPQRVTLDSLVSKMQRVCYQPGVFCDVGVDPIDGRTLSIVGLHVNGVVVVPKY